MVPPKAVAKKPLLNPFRGAGLKACDSLGREATTNFISLQRQLFGLSAAPSHY